MDQHVLDNLRTYLIAQNLVRDPDTTGSSAAPLWLEPEEGVPAPGEGDTPWADDNLVAAAVLATGIVPARHQGFIRRQGVEFIIRSLDAKEAVNFEDAIRNALNDKRDWMMHMLLVNESMIIRDLQPVTSGPQGYTFTFEYMFTLWQQ